MTHLPPGSYSFSLVDNARKHSIHVIGPLTVPASRPARSTSGPQGPTGRTFPSHRPRRRNGATSRSSDGLYRLFCDLHGDLMNSSVPVGNYLSAEVAGGHGRITGPSGMGCTYRCGIGVPDGSPPVSLTATPAAGYEFAGWFGGPCSGTGPCTVSVNGLVEVKAVFRELPAPPPPPAEVASARLTEVKVGKVARARMVTLRLAVDAPTQVSAQLRRAGAVLASARATLLPGARTMKLRVGSRVKAGRATVRLSLQRAGSSKTFGSRTVRLPGLR